MNKLLFAGILAVILVIAGCASSENSAGGAAAAAGGASGTASASAQGFGGEVTVTVTLENGKIAKVEAAGPSETGGIGSRAVMMLPAQMVSNNTFDVDALGGATITSGAVIEAAKAAAAQIK